MTNQEIAPMRFNGTPLALLVELLLCALALGLHWYLRPTGAWLWPDNPDIGAGLLASMAMCLGLLRFLRGKRIDGSLLLISGIGHHVWIASLAPVVLAIVSPPTLMALTLIGGLCPAPRGVPKFLHFMRYGPWLGLFAIVAGFAIFGCLALFRSLV